MFEIPKALKPKGMAWTGAAEGRGRLRTEGGGGARLSAGAGACA